MTTVLATSMVFGVSGASAGRLDPPGHQDANSCVNSYGVDLNRLYGISDHIRSRDCRVVSAGEHWIRPLWWVTDDGSDSAYPAGYVPSHPAPMDDFLAKLVAVKMVIDGGTSQEKTYVFNPTQVVRTDIDAEQLEPGAWGTPFPMASLLPRLRPLSVGRHLVEPYLVLSAQHCDGFTTDVEWSCIPAGEVSFFPGGHPLIVTTPAH